MNLPFPEVGKTQEQTINNLFDAVIKLRKELSYSLMHLDEDNIPGLNEIISDTAGNTAQLSVQAGQISTLVTTVDGHSSSITQQAGQIQSIVTDVSTLGGVVSGHTSSITQLSSQISLKVSSADYTASIIVGMINGASGVEISASKIALNGITRVANTLQIGDENTATDHVITFLTSTLDTGPQILHRNSTNTLDVTNFRTGGKIRLYALGNISLISAADISIGSSGSNVYISGTLYDGKARFG